VSYRPITDFWFLARAAVAVACGFGNRIRCYSVFEVPFKEDKA